MGNNGNNVATFFNGVVYSDQVFNIVQKDAFVVEIQSVPFKGKCLTYEESFDYTGRPTSSAPFLSDCNNSVNQEWILEASIVGETKWRILNNGSLCYLYVKGKEEWKLLFENTGQYSNTIGCTHVHGPGYMENWSFKQESGCV